MVSQTVLNGVNVDRLVETIHIVQTKPDLARFRFRATTEWVEGAQSRTSIQGFYGVGQEDISRGRPFYLISDEPPVLLGTNTAPNAVELILAALASCLSVGFIYNAAAQGIKVNSLVLSLEGDLDLRGFLGLSAPTRPGYQNIRVSCRIDGDAPREELEALCEYVQRTSPVLDILRNSVPVSIQLED